MRTFKKNTDWCQYWNCRLVARYNITIDLRLVYIFNMCCYVIVTLRSLVWSLLSIFVFLIELASMMSAHWLISQSNAKAGNDNSSVVFSRQEETVIRTTGLFFRCEETGPVSFLSVSKNCRVYAHSIDEIASPFWVATCIFLAIAILCLFVVAMFSIVALCRRSIGRKSIFSISGILQAIAGIKSSYVLFTDMVVFMLLEYHS